MSESVKSSGENLQLSEESKKSIGNKALEEFMHHQDEADVSEISVPNEKHDGSINMPLYERAAAALGKETVKAALEAYANSSGERRILDKNYGVEIVLEVHKGEITKMTVESIYDQDEDYDDDF